MSALISENVKFFASTPTKSKNEFFKFLRIISESNKSIFALFKKASAWATSVLEVRPTSYSLIVAFDLSATDSRLSLYDLTDFSAIRTL